ncbi:hypothetical protein [Microbacterium sp.]|uniref:hypothetical protein n=1 Tax=Microbacterium sp. TaxID=51671 RepID=UPI002810BAF6|nr:hypothetical protein [Microbacterium sp.]
MFIAIIIAALVIWALIATVVELRRDGYRAAPTEWSRLGGVEPLQRAESQSAYR